MNKTTICKQCGDETPQKRFATYRTRKGELRRRAVCKDCRNRYQIENRERLTQYRREYNKKNRSRKQRLDAERRAVVKAYVDKVKAAPCTDCGQEWPPVAMDFDHGSQPKTKSVARLVGSGYKLELIKEEIAKCELVCACCHRIRTWSRDENLASNKPRSAANQ